MSRNERVRSLTTFERMRRQRGDGTESRRVQARVRRALNFYPAAIDAQMRGENDELTISLLLCKQRNRLMAEYGARGFAPIGVAEYRLIEALAGSLPSVEDIERDAAAPAVKPADDEGSRGALKTFFAQAMGMSP